MLPYLENVMHYSINAIKVASTPEKRNHYYFPGLVNVSSRKKVAAMRQYREGSLKLALLRGNNNPLTF